MQIVHSTESAENDSNLDACFDSTRESAGVTRTPSRAAAATFVKRITAELRNVSDSNLRPDDDDEDDSGDGSGKSARQRQIHLASSEAYLISLKHLQNMPEHCSEEARDMQTSRDAVNQRVRRSYVGRLYSSFPKIANDIADLYALNEEQRLAYYSFAGPYLRRLRGESNDPVRIYIGGTAGKPD